MAQAGTRVDVSVRQLPRLRASGCVTIANARVQAHLEAHDESASLSLRFLRVAWVVPAGVVGRLEPVPLAFSVPSSERLKRPAHASLSGRSSGVLAAGKPIPRSDRVGNIRQHTPGCVRQTARPDPRRTPWDACQKTSAKRLSDSSGAGWETWRACGCGRGPSPTYEAAIERHLIPHIGRVPLSKLSPQQLQAWLRHLEESGVSAQRRRYARVVLRIALNTAMRWNLVIRNAATLVDPPRVTPREIRPFTPRRVPPLPRGARASSARGALHGRLSLRAPGRGGPRPAMARLRPRAGHTNGSSRVAAIRWRCLRTSHPGGRATALTQATGRGGECR